MENEIAPPQATQAEPVDSGPMEIGATGFPGSLLPMSDIAVSYYPQEVIFSFWSPSMVLINRLTFVVLKLLNCNLNN